MQFFEKIDFLMNITKTTNSALSLYIKLDASYISRLRRGQRSPLRDEAILKTMAAYFAKNLAVDYQQKALADALNINQLPGGSAEMADLIAQWLLNGKKNEMKTVANFLSGFSHYAEKQKSQPLCCLSGTVSDFPKTDISIYYGVDGKRQAVISFLSEVLAQTKPQTLLLFSDEATDWMTTDRAFATHWASLMMQVLAKGNRIKIIHTISRHLDEMLNAINQWIPLYMSGAIEPYFYPKKRDGIFKNTLFISPGVSAVISSSVGSMIDQAANLLFRSKEAIKAFEQEFYQYLGMCRPLMSIFTDTEKQAYFDTLLEFEKEKSDSIILTESLSLMTMPESVANRIIARVGKAQEKLYSYQKERTLRFEDNIQTNTFTEIIRLFDPARINNAKVKAAFSVILDGGAVYYTAEEYILHLEHILTLLKTYQNFHVCFTAEETEIQYMVYSREDLGTIVAKTSSPPLVLAINETNMTAAFWDFLCSMIPLQFNKDSHEKEIARLTEYIDRLK